MIIATAFVAGPVKLFLNRQRIEWTPVLPYAPMATRRAELMVFAVTFAIKRTLLCSGLDSEDALLQVLYGYCRRIRKVVLLLYRLMFGIKPRMVANDSVTLWPGVSLIYKILKLLSSRGKGTCEWRGPPSLGI